MEFEIVKGQSEVVFYGYGTYNLHKIEGLADKLQLLYDSCENKYLVEYFIMILDYFLGYEVDDNSTCSKVLSMYTEIVFYGALSGIDTSLFNDIRPWLDYYLYACNEQMEAQELSLNISSVKENINETPAELQLARDELLALLKDKIQTTKII